MEFKDLIVHKKRKKKKCEHTYYPVYLLSASEYEALNTWRHTKIEGSIL